jgi:hypothetical protein
MSSERGQTYRSGRDMIKLALSLCNREFYLLGSEQMWTGPWLWGSLEAEKLRQVKAGVYDTKAEQFAEHTHAIQGFLNSRL